MIFKNEHGDLLDQTNIETFEQDQVERFITSDCVVLELGARYGMVSCVINKKLSIPTNQVSVEPDERVWESLENNMIANGCNFHIIRGIISLRKMELTDTDMCEGYAARTILSDESTIMIYSLSEIENTYNLKFNTLVADCEGFLDIFFEENPRLYEQLNLVIFEKDGINCDYVKITNKLLQSGFEHVESINIGRHHVYKKPL